MVIEAQTYSFQNKLLFEKTVRNRKFYCEQEYQHFFKKIFLYFEKWKYEIINNRPAEHGILPKSARSLSFRLTSEIKIFIPNILKVLFLIYEVYLTNSRS
jgi:hypothetical protein